jgi:hypothetical protein
MLKLNRSTISSSDMKKIRWDGEFAINQSRQKAKALNTKQLSNRKL